MAFCLAGCGAGRVDPASEWLAASALRAASMAAESPVPSPSGQPSVAWALANSPGPWEREEQQLSPAPGSTGAAAEVSAMLAASASAAAARQPMGEPSVEPEPPPFTTLSGWDVEARLTMLGAAADAAERLDRAGSACSDGTSAMLSGAATSCGDVPPEASAIGGAALAALYPGVRGAAMLRRAEESYYALPDVLPPEPPAYVDQRPSSQFIERGLGACVRDGGGNLIVWPWEAQPPTGDGVEHVPPKRLRAPHRTDALREKGMKASMAGGDMGRGLPGVKHWKAFCAGEATPHDRPVDPNSPLWVKLEEELLAMQFVCALVQDRGVTVGTAASYFGQVQGWHVKEHGIKLAAGMKLGRLPAMLKGLRRAFGEAPRAVRRGIAPQALRRAMDLLMPDRSNPTHANIRAALAVALQGLLRSAEFACDPGTKWNGLRNLSRADIAQCTPERLVLMMLPCKNMRHLSGKTCPLIIGAGGEFIDAVEEVRNMLAVDPVPAHAAGDTPLFRDPSTNEPLRTHHLRDLIRRMMAAVGESTPSDFGTHSLRIGGATALFAAGADETVIRTMGRWSSDCYRLYVRACFESTLKWSARAGSQVVHDLAGEFDEVDFY